MLAIGAGGLDVAMAMAGKPFYLIMPKVYGIRLTGRLQPWVSARDILLEVLRRLSVKGGVGYIMEYFGPGVAELTVTDRATITNFGAELGATTSVFPSDAQTRRFLASQGREEQWRELVADPDAEYSEVMESGSLNPGAADRLSLLAGQRACRCARLPAVRWSRSW